MKNTHIILTIILLAFVLAACEPVTETPDVTRVHVTATAVLVPANNNMYRITYDNGNEETISAAWCIHVTMYNQSIVYCGFDSDRDLTKAPIERPNVEKLEVWK